MGGAERCTTFPFRGSGASRCDSAIVAAGTYRGRGAICAARPLVGLNSFDFLVSDQGFWLLEINPRPGATLDIFETADPASNALFALHVAACEGRLAAIPRQSGACAMEIVYAERDLPNAPAMVWPAWAHDRQPAGGAVGRGEPFCTVVAIGETVEDARARLDERAALIRSSIHAQAA